VHTLLHYERCLTASWTGFYCVPSDWPSTAHPVPITWLPTAAAGPLNCSPCSPATAWLQLGLQLFNCYSWASNCSPYSYSLTSKLLQLLQLSSQQVTLFNCAAEPLNWSPCSPATAGPLNWSPSSPAAAEPLNWSPCPTAHPVPIAWPPTAHPCFYR